MSTIHATAAVSCEEVVAGPETKRPQPRQSVIAGVENATDEDWALGVRVGALCEHSMEIVENSRAILAVRDTPQDV